MAGYFCEKGWNFIKEAFYAKVKPSGHLLPFLKIFPEIQEFLKDFGIFFRISEQSVRDFRSEMPLAIKHIKQIPLAN